MPSLVSDAAQAVADALGQQMPAPSARWRWGTVSAVNADGTMDVEVAGTELAGLHAAQHVMGAAAGDRVRITYLGTEAIVDAVLAPANGAGGVVEFVTVSSSTQSISSGGIVEFTASIPEKTGYTCRGAVQVWTSGSGTTIVGAPWRTAANNLIHAKAHAHASASITVYWLLLYSLDLSGWSGGGGGGGGSGTDDYEQLLNKPSIEGVTLVGNKSFEDLGLIALTNVEINDIVVNGGNSG